eukprot:Colp12_sorted_trinity150504_noHs@22501
MSQFTSESARRASAEIHSGSASAIAAQEHLHAMESKLKRNPVTGSYSNLLDCNVGGSTLSIGVTAPEDEPEQPPPSMGRRQSLIEIAAKMEVLDDEVKKIVSEVKALQSDDEKKE